MRKRKKEDGDVSARQRARYRQPYRRLPEASASEPEQPEALRCATRCDSCSSVISTSCLAAFRTVFVLRALEELSVEETATSLGIPGSDGANPFLPRSQPVARRARSGRSISRSATRSLSTARVVTASSRSARSFESRTRRRPCRIAGPQPRPAAYIPEASRFSARSTPSEGRRRALSSLATIEQESPCPSSSLLIDPLFRRRPPHVHDALESRCCPAAAVALLAGCEASPRRPRRPAQTPPPTM